MCQKVRPWNCLTNNNTLLTINMHAYLGLLDTSVRYQKANNCYIQYEIFFTIPYTSLLSIWKKFNLKAII